MALAAGGGLIGALVPAESATAATTTAWKTGVNTNIGHLLTHLDGSVTTGNCSGAAQINSFETYDSAGRLSGSVPAAGPASTQTCDGMEAVGRDGTVYAVAVTQQGQSSVFKTELVAYRGNTLSWRRELGIAGCQGKWYTPQSLTIGINGNIYTILKPDGTCVSQAHLAGFRSSDGGSLFDVPLGFGTTEVYDYNSLAPYQGGLVLWQRNGSSSIRYFSYTGVQLSSYPVSLPDGEFPVNFGATTAGRAVVLAVKNQPRTESCSLSQVTTRVLAFDPGGAAWQTAVQPCSLGYWLVPTPAGGAVTALTQNASPNGTGIAPSAYVLNLDANGREAWRYSNTKYDGNYGVYGTFSVAVDVNGNVLHTERYDYSQTVPTIVARPGVQLTLINGKSGQRIAQFSTRELSESKGFALAAPPASAKDRLYAMLIECPHDKSTCGWTGPPQLYALNFAGVTIDYPRGALLGGAGQPAPTPSPTATSSSRIVNYVALGDSYSSGEGVDPYFRDGYDQKSGVQTGRIDNRCHRSSRAYAEWVQPPGYDRPLYTVASGSAPAGTAGQINKYGSDLNVRTASGVTWSFWACSGATTTNVLPTRTGGKTQYDRFTQLDNPSISSSTDLITITIGGNDVGFGPRVKQCFLSACNNSQFVASLNAAIDGMATKLTRVYAAIRAKAPRARVIVLGYPQIFPASSSEQGCTKLIPFRGEQDMLRAATTRLNSVISRSAVGAGFEFVSVSEVFAGHEVCGSAGEWINGPSTTYKLNRVFTDDESFHPNLLGQRFGYGAAVSGTLRGNLA